MPNARASSSPVRFYNWRSWEAIRLPCLPGWDCGEGELHSVLSAAQMGRSIPQDSLVHRDPSRGEPGTRRCSAYLRLEPSCSLPEVPILCPSSGL